MCEKKDAWEEAWERADDTGIYTMDQCCEIADEVDPDHDYGSSDNSEEVDDSEESEDE